MADENDDGLGSVSGLPDELGIDEDLARSEQRANVRVESRRYDKPMTIIEGLDSDSVDLDDLASELKSALAVGGTVDEGRIELQGDHAGRAPNLLREQGFEVE
jgi:translation initiation factor 1